MPRLAWSKRKGVPSRRPRPNQSLVLEPCIAQRELQTSVDPRVVISNRRVRKVDGPHIKSQGARRTSENMHSHTDSRGEVEILGISGGDLICGIDKSTLG